MVVVVVEVKAPYCIGGGDGSMMVGCSVGDESMVMVVMALSAVMVVMAQRRWW